MHGCKKKKVVDVWIVSSGTIFWRSSTLFLFFCVGDFQVLTRGSELKIFFAFMCNRIDILSGKKKKQIKKQILQFGRPPDELSSQHVFCSEQPNPHHLFPDLRVCLSFVLQAFFLIFILFFLKTNITWVEVPDVGSWTHTEKCIFLSATLTHSCKVTLTNIYSAGCFPVMDYPSEARL